MLPGSVLFVLPLFECFLPAGQLCLDDFISLVRLQMLFFWCHQHFSCSTVHIHQSFAFLFLEIILVKYRFLSRS